MFSSQSECLEQGSSECVAMVKSSGEGRLRCFLLCLKPFSFRQLLWRFVKDHPFKRITERQTMTCSQDSFYQRKLRLRISHATQDSDYYKTHKSQTITKHTSLRLLQNTQDSDYYKTHKTQTITKHRREAKEDSDYYTTQKTDYFLQSINLYYNY